MRTRTNQYPEVATLQALLANTLEQIDCALDKSDRRAFKVWAMRHASLTARMSSLLLKIAQA